VIIIKVSLTQSLIPRIAVVRIKASGISYIPYMKGVSKKFKHIGNQYNIAMTFKTKHTLVGSLMKTWLERDPQQIAQCAYSIPCECGKRYIGKTDRPLAM
jgi:hypothetical protein